MNRLEFKEMVKQLYMYFQKKEPANSEQIDLWFSDVKFIDSRNVEAILDILKKNDNLPRNIPKAIKAAYYQLPRAKKPKIYDEYDDPEYPVENLWTALDILERKGNDEFMQYCRTHKMPVQDIERVKNKFNQLITVEDVKALSEKIGEKIKENKNKYSPEYMYRFQGMFKETKKPRILKNESAKRDLPAI